MKEKHVFEKEMATHPSILAWKILWTEEPDGLQSMGLQRVGLALASKQIGKVQMKKFNRKLFICGYQILCLQIKIYLISLFLHFIKIILGHKVFPAGSVSKEYSCSAGDSGSIPRKGRSPGEGYGNPLQYSWFQLVLHPAHHFAWCTLHVS